MMISRMDGGVVDLTHWVDGVGFDAVEISTPDGARIAHMRTLPLVKDESAHVGVGRPAVHKVLDGKMLASGTAVHPGITADRLDDDSYSVSACLYRSRKPRHRPRADRQGAAS
ncbi:MAG: hypothetical protein PSY12_01155 [bacterium]|nr:hypothetical protein [bacterium]